MPKLEEELQGFRMMGGGKVGREGWDIGLFITIGPKDL